MQYKSEYTDGSTSHLSCYLTCNLILNHFHISMIDTKIFVCIFLSKYMYTQHTCINIEATIQIHFLLIENAAKKSFKWKTCKTSFHTEMALQSQRFVCIHLYFGTEYFLNMFKPKQRVKLQYLYAMFIGIE